MKNRMVNNGISNFYDFESIESSFIYTKELVSKIFPEFKLINGTYSDTINNIKSSYGFITLECGYENYYFKIECERGVLGHRLEINNNFFSIYQYDKQMSGVLAFSKKNILFTLNVMRKIIDDESQ